MSQNGYGIKRVPPGAPTRLFPARLPPAVGLSILCRIILPFLGPPRHHKPMISCTLFRAFPLTRGLEEENQSRRPTPRPLCDEQAQAKTPPRLPSWAAELPHLRLAQVWPKFGREPTFTVGRRLHYLFIALMCKRTQSRRNKPLALAHPCPKRTEQTDTTRQAQTLN